MDVPVVPLGSGPALAVAGAFTAYLVLVEPWLGRRSHRRFLADLTAGIPHARTRLYLTWILWSWVVAAAAVGICVSGGLSLAHIGIRG